MASTDAKPARVTRQANECMAAKDDCEGKREPNMADIPGLGWSGRFETVATSRDYGDIR